MSHLQFGTLKYIRNHDISIDYIRILHMGTFWSLINRGWIQRSGGKIVLTRAGDEAYEQYSNGTANYRQKEGDISERVALMLSLKIREGAA